MILADTSAWVGFDRPARTAVGERLAALLRGGDEIVTTEPVILEVLSGARGDREEANLRRMLAGVGFVPFDAAVDFEGALLVYRTCRRQGVTVRGLVDCMIASVALRSGAALLADDADFVRMADVMPLELVPM